LLAVNMAFYGCMFIRAYIRMYVYIIFYMYNFE
jgi:hypothetical protein